MESWVLWYLFSNRIVCNFPFKHFFLFVKLVSFVCGSLELCIQRLCSFEIFGELIQISKILEFFHLLGI